MSTSVRQTLSYLQKLFDGHGLRPKGKLGQNFLIDLNLIELIVRSAELTKDDLVLEVGTGTGSLTSRLADAAGHVISVEIDPGFHALAAEILDGKPGVTLLSADILKNKNELSPEVMSLVHERLGSGHSQLKLVSNLPYVVATPVVSNLLLEDLTVERMVVTVQWEIAARLTASPGIKDYAALSVLVQSLADVEIIRRLAPSVFWPRPKVDSAIVGLRPSGSKRAHVGDVHRFRYFLRDLYVHRRKNLRGALSGWPSGRRDKSEVDARLQALGIPGTIRAEELGIEDHLRLARAFADYVR
jgi:16S rRNA (adenine1518-N6/adenine1519-N6)-dimethyltransferase